MYIHNIYYICIYIYYVYIHGFCKPPVPPAKTAKALSTLLRCLRRACRRARASEAVCLKVASASGFHVSRISKDFWVTSDDGWKLDILINDTSHYIRSLSHNG